MFPEDLFPSLLEDLAEAMRSAPAPTNEPLPCDPWIARSALQKAVRRGEVEIAQRALATLMQSNRGVWRALTIIGLEDLGVAAFDTLARVVAASQDQRWRMQNGGDWLVGAELVRQMAIADHDQSAVDLLLRVTNDPDLEAVRADALEAGRQSLVASIRNQDIGLVMRGTAALALGGGLVPEQRYQEPATAFYALGSTCSSACIVAVSQSAWRVSRNEMSLLLPLVWDARTSPDRNVVRDDELTPVTLIGGVPDVALDQFTRTGRRAILSLLNQTPDLKAIFRQAEVPQPKWLQVVGDVLFLHEGGLLARRVIWPIGDKLRLPFRSLSGAFLLGSHLEDAGTILAAQRESLLRLRSELLPISEVD